VAVGEERVRELSRMLSGSPDSASARQHAAELLAAAAAERGRPAPDAAGAAERARRGPNEATEAGADVRTRTRRPSSRSPRAGTAAPTDGAAAPVKPRRLA